MNRMNHDPAIEAMKRRLRRTKRAAMSLEEKRGRIAALESLVEGIGGLDGTKSDHKVLEALIGLRSSLLEDVMVYAAMVREVELLFQRGLPDARHHSVMSAHYLGFAPWERVAEQIGYTPRHVMRLHREAMTLLTEHMYHNEALSPETMHCATGL